jgi:peroxiredoxin
MNLKQTLEALRDRHMADIDDFARRAFEDELDRLRMMRVAEDGLGVGDVLPDFALDGADGRLWRSGDLLDRGPLVLAFFRGGWCPYCDVTMAALDRATPALAATGASVAGIMPETIEHVRRTADMRRPAFTLLSDPCNAYARLCGLVYELSRDHIRLHRDRRRDLPALHGDTVWRLPVPAVFVVESTGRVVFAFSDADPARWPDPGELIDSLNALGHAA